MTTTFQLLLRVNLLVIISLGLLLLLLLQLLLLHNVGVIVQSLIELELLHLLTILDFLILRYTIRIQFLAEEVIVCKLLLLVVHCWCVSD